MTTPTDELQLGSVGEIQSPAAEFVDYVDANPSWFRSFLIGLTVLTMIIAAIIAATVPKGLPTWLPFFSLAIPLGVLFLVLFVSPRSCARQIANKSDVCFSAIVHEVFRSPWRLSGQDLRPVMKAIVGQGRCNVVARVNRRLVEPITARMGELDPRTLTGVSPIRPLSQVFEPVPVDESVPLFVALEQEDDQFSTPQLSQSNLDQREATRKLKRNVTLAGGWLIMVIFGLNAFMGLLDLLVSGRMSASHSVWIPLFFLSILGLGGRGAYSWRQQWMLVPGGIVSRRSKMFRSETELHLFKRTESVLIAEAAQQKLCAVYVADARASQMARMTAREAHLLLRAWLSPIPPPPMERLSDLQ